MGTKIIKKHRMLITTHPLPRTVPTSSKHDISTSEASRISRNIKQHGIESMCGIGAGPTPNKAIAERSNYRSTDASFI